jgi:tripartite ATP-independent transporter DctM subunit
MTGVFTENLPLWMFVGLFFLLMVGYPVAFSIGGVALGFGLLSFGAGFFELLPIRIWSIIQNFTLIAVPLYVFMGVTLERSGLAEDLLDTMGLLFGRLRGGLAIGVIVVGALLAASTGIVGATTVTMGLLALPTMLRRKYSPELCCGVIAASGTLGQIIPPSIVLVVLADIVGVSVGSLYAGAFIPGLVLVGLYLVYVLAMGLVNPAVAPAFAAEDMLISRGELARRVMKSLLPPAALILAVLGSIFIGLASPTEAAALGAFASLLLAAWNRQLSLKMLREVMEATARLTSMVFIILVGATVFGLVFRGMGGDDQVREFLGGLQLGLVGELVLVNAALFFAGFFLDFIEITFIFIPVVAPYLLSQGVDPLWFCILVAVNLQTSFLTPPFGYALFYLRSVLPQGLTTTHIYRGIVPFVVLQALGLLLVALYPQLSTWLPKKIF